MSIELTAFGNRLEIPSRAMFVLLLRKESTANISAMPSPAGFADERQISQRVRRFLWRDVPIIVCCGGNRASAAQILGNQLANFLRRSVYDRQSLIDVIPAAAPIPVIIDGDAKFLVSSSGFPLYVKLTMR